MGYDAIWSCSPYIMRFKRPTVFTMIMQYIIITIITDSTNHKTE